MSLKAELETWAAALKAYDEEDFEKSLELFTQIADSSKIFCNMGLIYATLGEHEAAVERFIEATSLDQYFAVAYFQCGVSNFLLTRYDLAYKDFDEALLYLRGNQAINYEQLGLKFRLFSAEVLFNKGLSLIYMGRTQQGLADMEEARREKATEEHNVIDDAIADRGEGYTVFSIPVGVLYRPSEKKLKNSVTKDYLGKAKLVASSDPTDDVVDFTGAVRLKLGISPSGIYLDRREPDKDGLSPTTLRSTTLPAPSWRNDSPKPSGVERVNTSPFGGRDNKSTTKATLPNDHSPSTAGVARSNTQITPLRPSPNATLGDSRSPARNANPKKPAATQSSGVPSTDFSELYDDYTRFPVRGGQSLRSGSLTGHFDRSILSGNDSSASINRSGSRSLRGARHRRLGHTTSHTRGGHEDEEGYISGEYEDNDMTVIRIKIHYQDDIRGMTIATDATFADFMQKVCSKFKKRIDELDLKFTDEDGGKITLRDESDFEMALVTARELANGKSEGKLELWCIGR